MLYHLLYPFHTQLSALNVTRYITFPTAAATLSALAISLLFGANVCGATVRATSRVSAANRSRNGSPLCLSTNVSRRC